MSYMIMLNKKVDIIDEIDITDKEILEEQINISRKALLVAIRTLESTYKEINDLNKKITEKKTKIRRDNLDKKNTEINLLISDDDEIMSWSYMIDTLKSSVEIIKHNINYLESDIYILKSSMYNKF